MLTYDELIRRTPEWLYATNRRLVNEMPAIVEQAHQQLIHVMDHDLFRTLVTTTVGPGNNGVLDLSTQDPRVLEVRAVRLRYRDGDDDWTPMRRRGLEFLSMLYPRNRPKRPGFYAEYNGPLVLKLFPNPDRDYDVEVTANVEPPVLSPTTQTNIISQQFPRAIEKATFRQAALFQKNWEDAAKYEQEMMSAITEANAQVQRRKRDETEQRPMDTTNVDGT